MLRIVWSLILIVMNNLVILSYEAETFDLIMISCAFVIFFQVATEALSKICMELENNRVSVNRT